MALININLDEAEQKLVNAVTGQILPQIVQEVTSQIIPSLQSALDGMKVDFHITVNISQKKSDGTEPV